MALGRQKRLPCKEIGHDWWHAPDRVEQDGSHIFSCRYCEQQVKTPGKDNPDKIGRKLGDEVEEYLRGLDGTGA